MRVLLTGQSGIEKKSFFADLMKLVNEKDTRCCDPDVLLDKDILDKARIDCAFDVEDEFQSQKKCANYLDMNESEFIAGKQRILREYDAKYPRESNNNILAATHLVYFRKKSFFWKMDWESLKSFHPDKIITLIDDITTVSENIRRREDSDDYVRATNLKDLMMWRNVEIMLSKLLAEHLDPGRKIPYYLIARNHKPQIIYQLMFETGKKVVYASFPISKIKDDHAAMSQVGDFKRKLKSKFIVFDPYTIKEKTLHDRVIEILNGVVPSSSGFVDVEGAQFRIEEILPIFSDITGQIITRDEMLVSQSEAVLAYRPGISEGSQYELSFAEGLGKRLMSYSPKKDGNSPFAMKAGTVDTDFDKFIKRIDEYAQT